ncbi:PTS system ascorbate-specific transporter subunit IIA [Listeria floridensis FSL S10-1187]|uniref:Ascorbate-specific PTS system EIIA component n=1 Tax=Listeria floridensis FSL S10-1187 TaxID=1265817 RepID=A0ABP3AYM2_9LIST|nr:PTS sugar transporter subunit IIA [Listeria floridensis]EUJ31671.1 PTS system ascorbate-specific transporter subunit IIA [Listeria floridensis FSL S10-1187]
MVSLKESLIENRSIRLRETAETWQEAVGKAVQPLVQSGAVEVRYEDAIVASTEHFGPYYILMDGMAMPHARPEDGVNRDAFSLVTLENPVAFSDGKKVEVLLALAATSSEIHTGIAIPQIVALFETPDIIAKLKNVQSPEEVLQLIDQADLSKYVHEE